MSADHTPRRGAGGYRDPGNAKDRDRFDRLGPAARNVVADLSRDFYDGTRTVAACWRLALDEVYLRRALSIHGVAPDNEIEEVPNDGR